MTISLSRFVRTGAESIPVGDLNVLVISLDDLIAIKRHFRRPKDQAALFQLDAIKQLREEGKT